MEEISLSWSKRPLGRSGECFEWGVLVVREATSMLFTGVSPGLVPPPPVKCPSKRC